MQFVLHKDCIPSKSSPLERKPTVPKALSLNAYANCKKLDWRYPLPAIPFRTIRLVYTVVPVIILPAQALHSGWESAWPSTSFEATRQAMQRRRTLGQPEWKSSNDRISYPVQGTRDFLQLARNESSIQDIFPGGAVAMSCPTLSKNPTVRLPV